MMSRFTERAQEALQKAQQIMFAKQHTQLDVEHVFLALLQQRDSITSQIISRLGGDPQAMARRLDKVLDSTQQSFSGARGVSSGYITLRCNRVLQGAADEADLLLDEFISAAHLFLAIVRERGGSSAKLLEEAGFDYDRSAAALKELRDVRPDEFVGVSMRQARGHRRRILRPESLARPVGFSHGILTQGGHLLFLAGQTSIDAEGKVVAPSDIVRQYRQVLTNLEAVVEEAGGDITDIVKMTIFVSDRDNYIANLKALGQVHKDFFDTYYPATALLEISRFFQDGVMVEIEGIAVIGG